MKNLRALLLALSLGLIPAFAWAAGWLPLAKAPAFSLTFGQENQAASGTTVNYGILTYGSGCTRVVSGNVLYSTGISSETVNGSSLGAVSGAFVITGSFAGDIWMSSAAVAGSSGNVSVTYAGAIGFNSSTAVYCLITATPSPGTAVHNIASGTSVAISVTIPAGGGALVISGSSNGNAITGITNAAIDKTDVTNGINQTYAHTTATGTITVTASYASTDAIFISVVPWGP